MPPFVPENSYIHSITAAAKYLGATMQLFAFLFVLKTAYLATSRPMQIRRSLLAAFLSALVSSQVFAIGFHVFNFLGAFSNIMPDNRELERNIRFILIFSATDLLVLTLMKWRNKRTVLGLIVINLLFAWSGLAQASVWEPVMFSGFVQLFSPRH
jgi:hypothetical protein